MRVGWSREALAYHSGVSWSAIAQIESGRRRDVRLSSLSALAEALGVSVDYLVGGKATLAPHLFEHRLLTYGSDEEYLEAAIPYVTEGLERAECVLVVTTPAQTALVRDALDVATAAADAAYAAGPGTLPATHRAASSRRGRSENVGAIAISPFSERRRACPSTG